MTGDQEIHDIVEIGQPALSPYARMWNGPSPKGLHLMIIFRL
jgi:hypothetical protein